MKAFHKKIIAIGMKDILPFAVNQSVNILNGAVESSRIENSDEQLNRIEKLIKKVSVKNNGQVVSFSPRNIEDIGVSKEELGRRTWNKIHTKAAALPKDASPEQTQKVMKEINDMVHEYPCIDCRENSIKIANEINILAPKTRESAVLKTWELHNKINEKLEKVTFSIEELRENYDF